MTTKKQRWLSSTLGPTGDLVAAALASIETAPADVLDNIGARFRGWWGWETDVGDYRLKSLDAVEAALLAEDRAYFMRRASTLAGFVTYRDGVRFGAVPAAVDACVGLLASDLVGQHGLEQTHVDFLVGPFDVMFARKP